MNSRGDLSGFTHVSRLFFILPRVIANGEKSVGDQTADGDSSKEGDDKGTSNSSEKDKDWKGGL